MTPEEIAAARAAGYTDAEILDHYAKMKGIDLTEARKEGYSNAELLSHFSGADVQPQEEKKEAPAAAPDMLSNPKLAAGIGAGAGAVYSGKMLPVKAAKAFGSAIADKIPEALQRERAPLPKTYETPSGIAVEPTPGGLHPGAVGNAQFNVEQQQANALRQNMPSGFEQRGTSRIMTPVGMEAPAAALGGAPAPAAPSTLERLQGLKSVVPAVGKNIQRIATSAPAAGAIAGYNFQQAQNAARAGDTTGENIGYVGAGSQLVPASMLGKYKFVKPLVGIGAGLINTVREPKSVMAPGYKDGRAVLGEELVKQGIKAARNIFTPKASTETRMSEALSNDIGKWVRPTQADRMRSIEGDLGGIGFSKFQHEKPEYAEAKSAWGVMNPTAATRIANLNAEKGAGNTIWTPMIGSPTQHHSNQHVHDTLVQEFNRQASLGKLTPELRNALNQRAMTYTNRKTGNPIFSEGIDFGDPEQLASIGTTFEKRAALGELFGGKGVGGRKGAIIPYEDIMTEYMDPATRGIQTHSLGNRLFTLTGEHSARPDLHSAFPQNLSGEDRAVILKDLPSFEVGMPDWNKQFLETHGGRAPGFFDKTLGSKKIGYPAQEITEPYLEGLYKAGYAEGGEVEHMAHGKLAGGLSMLPMAARTELRKRGQLAQEQGIPAALAMRDPAMANAYNSMPVQGGLTAASFANPAMFAATAGKDAIQSGMEGDAGGFAANLAGAALPYLGKVPQAVRNMVGMARANPRNPTIEERLYHSGSSDYQPVPAMAGGGDVVKSLIKKALGSGEGVAARTIEGSPHTYPPVASGPWMREYQPAARPQAEAGRKFPVMDPSSPEAAAMVDPYLVKHGSTYMVNNLPQPSEQRIAQYGLKNAMAGQRHPALQEAQDRTIHDLMEQKRMQYLRSVADPNTPGETLQDLMQQYPRWEDWM